MARSTVAQRLQIGVEAVHGTPVPADKSLGSMNITLSPEVESEARRPRGSKYPTLVTVNREHSTGDVEGTATYDELVYALASVLTQPSQVNAIPDADGAFLWEFAPSSNTADDPATYTLEQGDADHGERAAHVLFTDLGLSFSRDEVGLSGTVIAQALERGVDLTADPTPVAADLVPIQPGQVCVYLSDDPETLGQEGTHLTNALSMNLSIGGRYNPVWYLNCRLDSFGAYVEAPEPEFQVEAMVEADADGMDLVGLFRTGDTRFLRIEATGPQIDPGATASAYRLTIDLAVKVMDPGEYSDEDGLYAVEPTLQVVHDPTWGRAARVEVVNTLANL